MSSLSVFHGALDASSLLVLLRDVLLIWSIGASEASPVADRRLPLRFSEFKNKRYGRASSIGSSSSAWSYRRGSSAGLAVRAYLLLQYALQQQSRFEQDALRTARQVSLVVEAELVNLQTILEVSQNRPLSPTAI